ncbi:MAG: GNAT family N-acetyltransferase [Hyphomicrobium sp.]|uniref:GNAT family N-acetyltransferase n=1 Tax=Hyphomicrobium sp. TaxID=82 RepID=UPI0039E60BA5
MTISEPRLEQSIAIRRPEYSDLGGVFQCLRYYNIHVLWGDTERADSDFDDDEILTVRNAISHIDLADKCWIADNGEDILGFCCWDWRDVSSRSAKTVLISVTDAGRARNVGKLLQKRRLDEMRECGAIDVHTWSDDPRAVNWYQRTFGYQIMGHEPIRHSLHRFHHNGQGEVWAIHRGFREHDTLTHLRLSLEESRRPQ